MGPPSSCRLRHIVSIVLKENTLKKKIQASLHNWSPEDCAKPHLRLDRQFKTTTGKSIGSQYVKKKHGKRFWCKTQIESAISSHPMETANEPRHKCYVRDWRWYLHLRPWYWNRSSVGGRKKGLAFWEVSGNGLFLVKYLLMTWGCMSYNLQNKENSWSKTLFWMPDAATTTFLQQKTSKTPSPRDMKISAINPWST